MGLTIDWTGLNAAFAQIDTISATVPRVAAKIAPRLRTLVEGQFASGDDPYGVAWAPLRPSTIAKGRGAPPLTDTGMMRASVSSVVVANTVLLAASIPADFHQLGTVNMDQRQIFPDASRGLPADWEKVIVEAAEEP